MHTLRTAASTRRDEMKQSFCQLIWPTLTTLHICQDWGLKPYIRASVIVVMLSLSIDERHVVLCLQ